MFPNFGVSVIFVGSSLKWTVKGERGRSMGDKWSLNWRIMIGEIEAGAISDNSSR